MEPVTIEFVEQTADFFFHLTKLQLEERIAEYQQRQFNLYSVIFREASTHKDVHKKETVWRLALILVRCFESYEIKLPMISIISIKAIIKEDQKKSAQIERDTPKDFQIKKSIKEINQPNFFAYIENMYETNEEFRNLFDIPECHNLYFLLMYIGIVYAKSLSSYC